MEENSIIVYAITEKGPDIVHSDSSLSQAKLQEISLYHLLLVAQGTWHHKGIFVLPIPINELNEKSKAIYYGFTVYDEDQQDPRTNHTRYGCIIIFCPNETLAQCNIIELQTKLDKMLSKVSCYQDLKRPSFFNNLKRFVKKEFSVKKKIKAPSLKSSRAKQIEV